MPLNPKTIDIHEKISAESLDKKLDDYSLIVRTGIDPVDFLDTGHYAFLKGDVKLVFNRLIDLLNSNQRITELGHIGYVIAGDTGSGKTSFFNHLASVLKGRAILATVSASMLAEEDKPSQTLGKLIKLCEAHAKETGNRILLLIDDFDILINPAKKNSVQNLLETIKLDNVFICATSNDKSLSPSTVKGHAILGSLFRSGRLLMLPHMDNLIPGNGATYSISYIEGYCALILAATQKAVYAALPDKREMVTGVMKKFSDIVSIAVQHAVRSVESGYMAEQNRNYALGRLADLQFLLIPGGLPAETNAGIFRKVAALVNTILQSDAGYFDRFEHNPPHALRLSQKELLHYIGLVKDSFVFLRKAQPEDFLGYLSLYFKNPAEETLELKEELTDITNGKPHTFKLGLEKDILDAIKEYILLQDKARLFFALLLNDLSKSSALSDTFRNAIKELLG